MLEGKITSFAWNRALSDYMCAIGTHDGAIHIWTTNNDKAIDDDNHGPGPEVSLNVHAIDKRNSYASDGSGSTILEVCEGH